MNDTEMAERDDASAPLLYGQGQAGWLAVVTVVAVVALVLSFVAVVMASGDDGGGTAAGGDSGGGAVSDALTVTASEFAFDPPDVSIAAATEVPVTLENAGAVDHNWTVLSEEIAAEADFSEDLVLAAVTDTAGGATTEGAITIDEAGTYQVICTIPGHFDAGMVGSVTVQ